MNRERGKRIKPLNKRKYLFDKCGGICPSCGKKMTLNNPNAYRSYMTIDHIVPVSRGGTNNIENLQAMCRTCNMRKSDKICGIWTRIDETGHYVSEVW